MPKSKTVQSNFTSGVLDPKLLGRVDIQHYYNGLEQGENIIIHPQGGFSRRPGLRYIGQALGDGRLHDFEFNTEQTYLLVFTDLRVQFYRDDTLITAINGGGNDYLVSTYTAAQQAVLNFAQSADTLIIVHEDQQQRSLVRGTAHNLWTLSAIAFTSVPQFDYNDASSPTPTSYICDLTFGGSGDNDRVKLVLSKDGADATTEEIVYDSGDTTATAHRLENAIQKLYLVGNSGVDVAYQSGTVYRVTISGESADAFDAMTGYNTSGSLTVSGSTVQAGVSRKENIWSATRGYARSVCFYLQRLWFGGLKQKPDTYIGSVSGDAFNFEQGEGFDDDAIVRTMATAKVNAIQNIHPGDNLQLFTTGGEFYAPDFPLTPAKSGVKPSTKHGSAQIMVVEIDGAVLFCERRGKVIREFTFSELVQRYEAKPVSVLAPHLIRQPVDAAARKGSQTNDANYVYYINTDGTCAVFNTERSQDVGAWTIWSTNGKFKSVAVVDDEVYFLIERDIAGNTKYFIEKAVSTYYTDAATQVTLSPAGTTVTGLDHLDGMEVRVRVDGAVHPNKTVAGGQITLEYAGTNVEVGLNYNPTAETTPYVADVGGLTLGDRTKVEQTVVDVLDSAGIFINGKLHTDRRLDQDNLDSAPALNNGPIYKGGVDGWSRRQTVTISQTDPLPLTVRAIATRFEVNP